MGSALTCAPPRRSSRVSDKSSDETVRALCATENNSMSYDTSTTTLSSVGSVIETEFSPCSDRAGSSSQDIGHDDNTVGGNGGIHTRIFELLPSPVLALEHVHTESNGIEPNKAECRSEVDDGIPKENDNQQQEEQNEELWPRRKVGKRRCFSAGNFSGIKTFGIYGEDGCASLGKSASMWALARITAESRTHSFFGSGHQHNIEQRRTSILISPTSAESPTPLTAHNKEVTPSGILVRSSLIANASPEISRRRARWADGSNGSSVSTAEDTSRKTGSGSLSLSQLSGDFLSERCGSGGGSYSASSNNDEEREDAELESIIALINQLGSEEQILGSIS